MASQGFSFPPPPPPPPVVHYEPQQNSSNRGGGRGRGRGGGFRGQRGGNRGGPGYSGHAPRNPPYQSASQPSYNARTNNYPHNGAYPTPNYPPVQQPQQAPNPYQNQWQSGFSRPPSYNRTTQVGQPYQGGYQAPQNGYNYQSQGFVQPGNPIPVGYTRNPVIMQDPRAPKPRSPLPMGPPIRMGFDDVQSTIKQSHNILAGQKRVHNEAFGKARPSVAKTPAAPAVPSFGPMLPNPTQPIPEKSSQQPQGPSQTKPAKKKPKKKRQHNQLGLTPRKEEHESSEDDDEDEEARLAAAQNMSGGQGLHFCHRGRTSTLKTKEEIAAWIAERKKNYPTKTRAVEKQAEAKGNREIKAKPARENREKQQQQTLADKEKAKKEHEKKDKQKDEEKATQEKNLDPAEKERLKAEKLQKRIDKAQRSLAKLQAKAKPKTDGLKRDDVPDKQFDLGPGPVTEDSKDGGKKDSLELTEVPIPEQNIESATVNEAEIKDGAIEEQETKLTTDPTQGQKVDVTRSVHEEESLSTSSSDITSSEEDETSSSGSSSSDESDEDGAPPEAKSFKRFAPHRITPQQVDNRSAKNCHRGSHCTRRGCPYRHGPPPANRTPKPATNGAKPRVNLFQRLMTVQNEEDKKEESQRATEQAAVNGTDLEATKQDS